VAGAKKFRGFAVGSPRSQKILGLTSAQTQRQRSATFGNQVITTTAIFYMTEPWLNLCLPFLYCRFLKYGNIATVPPNVSFVLSHLCAGFV